MPQTLKDVIRRVRNKLNEPAYPTDPTSLFSISNTGQRFYTDTELTDWINDGLRDIARRAEDLITYDQTITVPAYTLGSPTPVFPLPLDLIRIHRMEFVPAAQSTYSYPLQPSTAYEMDAVWGTYQTNPASYPMFYVTRGYPGGLGRNQFTFQLYPLPSQAGTINIYYYRLPVRLSDPVVDSSQYNILLDMVEGWEDLIVSFTYYQALIKARNPAWKDMKLEYEEKVAQMIDQTRSYHDQAHMMSAVSGVTTPYWLYSPDW